MNIDSWGYFYYNLYKYKGGVDMNKESMIKFVRDQWIQLKDDMKKDNYKYTSLEEAAEHYELLRGILDLCSNEFTSKCRDYNLKKGVNITRVVEVPFCDVERIIPKREFCKENRMNPEGKYYGYYVLNYCGQNLNERIITGIKEKRLEKTNEISTCEFTVKDKDLKLAKFVIDKGIRLELEEHTTTLDRHKIKKYYDIHGGRKGREEIAEIYALNLMLNTMLLGDVFCPAEGNQEEKKYHYAPFHLIADYFERSGYDGILYQSSVDPNGVCVAIFNTDNVIALDDSLRCNIDVKKILEN